MTVHARPDAHFVITRFGIGMTDEDWYQQRLDLFEAVTFASLARQESQDFHWLVIVDPLIPGAARGRLEGLFAGHANFHIVAVDPTEHRRMTLGTLDWLWDGAQEHVLAEGLIDDVGDYIITSIVDDDDAWHVGTVEAVNRFLFGQYLGKLTHADRIDSGFAGLLVSHGAGAAITFPSGLMWNVIDDRHSPVRYPWHSMSGFVLSRFSSGVAATSARHDTVGTFASIPAFHVAEVETGKPTWLYVRHPEAMSLQSQPDTYGPPAFGPTSALHAALDTEFGIDLDAVTRYRKAWADHQPEDSGRSNVMGPHRRLSTQFRITALNRQLDALDRRLTGATDGQRDDLLRRRDRVAADRRAAVAQLRATPG